MTCEQVKELLSAYLDEALAQEERQSVADHLRTCSECSALLADFRRFDALIAQLPRVSPPAELRERILSSQEYLESIGTADDSTAARRRSTESTVPYPRMRRGDSTRPYLVAQQGERRTRSSPTRPYLRTRRSWLQHTMQVLIAATLLLTFGVASFIGWNIWQKHGQPVQSVGGIIPPAGPVQDGGPLPAGIRFTFLRDGALWSAPTDGSSGIARLTPTNVTVADHWTVKTPLPGHVAGNALAYIDLRQGYVHTIRSDRQNDTLLRLPLVKPGISPSSVWNTETGAAILNNLSWSSNGNLLAFVADPQGTGTPGLYLYAQGTGTIRAVPSEMKGAVTHVAWSPDGIRIAFVLTHNGQSSILDYNTQNNGLLTLASTVNEGEQAGDTVLKLGWSPNSNIPAVTWSVGSAGHIHSIWTQRVGLENVAGAYRLISGDFTEATYTPSGNDGQGGWLLVNSSGGQPGDVLNVDLSAHLHRLTGGRHASTLECSPDGKYTGYFDGLSSGVGTFHIVNMTTGNDLSLAAGIASNPAPVWSSDGKRLAYSTGTHIFVASMDTPGVVQPLKLQGSATALNWSLATSYQLVVATSGAQSGMYLVDTQHNTSQQIDKGRMNGPILWTQIP